MPATQSTLLNELLKNGISVDQTNGHLRYQKEFTPLAISYDLVFVRHGETYGNCGQVTHENKLDVHADKNSENRIYQGNVDTEINQLTEFGKEQAKQAAEKLAAELLNKGWAPDIIYHSPLKRARDTGLPFVEKFKFVNIYFPLEDIREMSFGSWDNRRVCDLPNENPCHLFYRDQNALVKDYGENFCELLLRAKQTLLFLETKHANKNVLMFSHSMFGAACSILLGKGNTVENGDYLAFDGKRKDGSHYIMPNATPFLLNSGATKKQFPHGFLQKVKI